MKRPVYCYWDYSGVQIPQVDTALALYRVSTWQAGSGRAGYSWTSATPPGAAWRAAVPRGRVVNYRLDDPSAGRSRAGAVSLVMLLTTVNPCSDRFLTPSEDYISDERVQEESFGGQGLKTPWSRGLFPTSVDR